ncbi:hypothetical protein DCCM_3793 [Desulfocucumis palustris]|uniref:Uncharacterized protein n=1 Tax=Desulfocucumis palustris TaxID=1898651 RepID=A0A2L2XG30_9FIRM|nr:hypothetical protein [Desulfocucumis palustris]GBF34673.1 hypothetical protein DCCM_3793 [Desulfocucumis palustris]
MFKSKLLIFVVFILIAALFITPASMAASDSNGVSLKLDKDEVLVFQADEITDDSILLERAKNGICDGPAFDAKATLTKDGVEKNSDKIKVYFTVQKLQSKKNSKTDKTTDLYKQTSYAIIPLSALAYDPDTDSDWDQTGAIKATSSIYYEGSSCYLDSKTRNGFRITKIAGVWNRYDSTVTWKNSKIGFWQQAFYSFKSDCSSNLSRTLGYDEAKPSSGIPTSGTTYNMNPSNPNGYYFTNDSGDQNRANMKIDLVRSGNTWNFMFANFLRDSQP